MSKGDSHVSPRPSVPRSRVHALRPCTISASKKPQPSQSAGLLTATWERGRPARTSDVGRVSRANNLLPGVGHLVNAEKLKACKRAVLEF
jgi:hypothetical protein